jgi:hypothetical protein
MKRFLALAVLCSASAFAADQSMKPIDGWISDSQCGAAHVGIGGGAKPVFVDDSKKQVWTIDNPDAVTGHYGHHVSVEATANPEEKTVHIAKVTMLKDQGNQSKPDEMGGMAH